MDNSDQVMQGGIKHVDTNMKYSVDILLYLYVCSVNVQYYSEVNVHNVSIHYSIHTHLLSI